MRSNLSWWDYTYSYSFMIFTRLIISSGIPVALFYISSYNHEYKMMARFRHSQFISEMGVKHLKNADRMAFIDGKWIASYNKSAKIVTRAVTSEEKRASFLFRSVPSYDIGDVPSTSQFSVISADCTNLYNSLFNRDSVVSYQTAPGNLHISSSILSYRMPIPWETGAAYWILFIAALLVFWQIIHRIIRKIFALNLPVDTGWEQIDCSLVANNNLNKLLFIIGAPGSGKLTNIKNKIADGSICGKEGEILIYDEKNMLSKNVLILDMISIPDSEADQEANDTWKKIKEKALEGCYLLVVVNHFEYDIKNPATNRTKLNFLEALLQANKAKVIIISTVHPVSFLDSLNQQEFGKEQDTRRPEHDLERWHVLLGRFRIVIDRLDVSTEAVKRQSLAWETDVFTKQNLRIF